MTETQIECFLAVANHLNFARAAEELNISQPAVTHQIQTLEAELNIKLFKRSTRFVSLTEEGNYFLDDAKSIQQTMFRAKTRFSNNDYEMLTIGCSSPSQIQLLSNALKQIRWQHPHIHPQFRHLTQSQIPQRIDDEVIDIAFGPKMDITSQKKVLYRELFQMSLSCVCPKDHPVSKLKSISLNEIQTHKLIIYTPISASFEITMTQKKLIGNKKINETYLCEFSEDAILLVEAGYGIAILPEAFVPKWANVCTIPIENIHQLSYGAYYKAHTSNKMVYDFFNLVKETAFEEESK